MAKIFQIDTGNTLTTSLLSYYKFETNSEDFFGPNPGVDTATTYASGKVGQAVNFVAANLSRIFCADPTGATNFGPNASYSLAFWVKYTDNVTDSSISEHWEGGGYAWAIRTGGSLRFNTYDQVHNPGTNCGNPNDGTWHHIVCVRDVPNVLLRIYLDGTQNNSTPDTTVGNSIASTSNGYAIGNRGNADIRYFNGALDEFGIWGKVLTQQEINDLYNSGVGQTMVDSFNIALIKP